MTCARILLYINANVYYSAGTMVVRILKGIKTGAKTDSLRYNSTSLHFLNMDIIACDSLIHSKRAGGHRVAFGDACMLWLYTIDQPKIHIVEDIMQMSQYGKNRWRNSIPGTIQPLFQQMTKSHRRMGGQSGTRRT